MKIAAWSGPRNLSTAMMYSFGARPDCAVTDEPFYASYLAATGLDHPMRAEILASQPTDAQAVAAVLEGPVPGGRPHWYQKHMAGHMLPHVPLGWTGAYVHVHLIRHPARVVASYLAKRESPTFDDIAFFRQEELYDRLGGIVVDSDDIRADPRVMLQVICAEIGLPFKPAMLSWPAGGHPSDGVWAAHWYDAVRRSAGFASTEGPLPILSGPAAELVDAALPHYRALAARALRPG